MTTEEDIEDGHTIRPEDEDLILMNYSDFVDRELLLEQKREQT